MDEGVNLVLRNRSKYHIDLEVLESSGVSWMFTRGVWQVHAMAMCKGFQ